MSFSAGDEPELVTALRNAGALILSLVADVDGMLAGHVAFWPAFAADGSSGWYAIGPISVEPPFQRRTEGVIRLMAMNAAGCVLVGDVNYYAASGFKP